MAKGTSGRIVVEIEPTLKRRLYSSLAMENLTLKQWFILEAEKYLQRQNETQQKPKAER
jgi:hypothetical protein